MTVPSHSLQRTGGIYSQNTTGPQPLGYYYTFEHEMRSRRPGMQRNTGFYYNRDTRWTGIVSACTAHDKAFVRRPDGSPHFHNNHAFHIENVKLVAWLENVCRAEKVTITDATVTSLEKGGHGVAALHTEDGRHVTADLIVDASGFRSELPGRTLEEPFLSYSSCEYITATWDDIRDFLAVHYAFNTRIDSPFWTACRQDTGLAGAARMVPFHRENGPSVLAENALFEPANSFAIDGFLTHLICMAVPLAKPWSPPPAEQKLWRGRLAGFAHHASRGYSVQELLTIIRRQGAVARQ